MGDRLISPQSYPLWAALVPGADPGQPMMTNDGVPIDEEIVDTIYPSCYRVVAWDHTDELRTGPVPILAGAVVSDGAVIQYAAERDEAENLARLRIRELLRSRGHAVGAHH